VSRLRELRLHGFKTFADPTRFVFERGVTAVIGPNGSGKSNMSDAVRWVLGEQSNRSLRTRRADDVIFAGSQQRKPQGMAEAVLTLDNADGWLPIDFNEVTIGRRAYRSGESDYLINGARARLRDVVELLGEGRLGANELVVVGQGTVDAALSLRPEERRQLFEEAAGVKNMQVRKNEALARLSRASDNLARLTDLVAELRPQVRRLAQQAQHQQEHDVLRGRARALVEESHQRRERTARSARGEARRRAGAAESALEALRNEQAAGRAAMEAAERRYWEAEAAARAASTQREATREAAIRAEGRLEALRGREAEANAAIARDERALQEARTARAARSGNDADAALDASLRRAAEAEERWRQASAALAAADAAQLAAEEAFAEIRQRRAAMLAEEARRAEALASTTARLERLRRELEHARQAHDEARIARTAGPTPEAAAAAEETSRRRLGDATARQETAQQQLAKVRRDATVLRERREAMAAQLAALRERAESGNELAATLAAAGWSLLLQEITAPEEAWPAIEAVVGGDLGDALLWHDDDPSPRLVGARGSVRLLSNENGSDDRAAALAAMRATRTVADWIGGGPAILQRAVVVDDLASLLAGWHRLPPGWLAVTQDGDLADARGVLTLRGRATPPGGAAARDHARRRELETALTRLEAEESAISAQVVAAQAELDAARAELGVARQAHEADDRSLRQARSAAEAGEARLARASRDLARLETEHAETTERLAALQKPAGEEPSDGGELAERSQAAAKAREVRAVALSARDAARSAWQTARSAAEAGEAQRAGERSALASLEGRIAQLEAALPGQRDALGALADQVRAAAAEAAQCGEQDAAASEQRAKAEAERERLRRELLELERGTEASARLAELERAAHASAVEASRHEEALAALQRERELALEGFEQGDEAAPPSPRPVEEAQDLLALDDTTLEAELRRVRRTLGQIGSVNPFAVEEHRDLSARLVDLETQDADLRTAVASTRELIDRLDGEIGERFNAAFAAIGERFDEFCRLLFAGGSASLQLAEAGEGAEGEAPGGIEIVVQPPGKRPQRLAMLSGGERALTGVALLFAMLSVNPVPFCVLDEVDAALDEANIGRFADALRKLAETIDFVVITHNRATMEVADTIYGVTMTDAAVSRVLSLRLADVPVEASA
jgi:chromosome segregation protein